MPESTIDPAVEEWKAFLNRRMEFVVPVTQPLALISQIQRSGGTLLSQLFDHHSQCHAHPYELYIGKPNKYTWPTIDLTQDPSQWFETLYEKSTAKHFARGYTKHSMNAEHEPDVFPFLFLVGLQKEIFLRTLAATPDPSLRHVFDAYMTSYFNAWADNQNLYGGSKKVVTGFVPRMNFEMRNIDQFFAAYPDGKFISICRDPQDWYPSAHRHDPIAYPDVATATAAWIRSTTATLEIKRKYGERMLLIEFGQLLKETERTMAIVSNFLGITYSPILLQPTFNGRDIRAASSFGADSQGILSTPLGRKELLTLEEKERIDQVAGQLWEAALEESRRSQGDLERRLRQSSFHSTWHGTLGTALRGRTRSLFSRK